MYFNNLDINLPQSIEQRRKNFYIGIFIQLPFPPIKNSMHTFYLQKRLSITAHNIFAWFYLWFLPSKYSIFLSSSTHESVNTLRQSNWCVLAHDTLPCSLWTVTYSKILFIKVPINEGCSVYHINPLNVITLYLRYTHEL